VTVAVSSVASGDRTGAGAILLGTTDDTGAAYVTALLYDPSLGAGGVGGAAPVISGNFALQLGWSDPTVVSTSDPFSYGSAKGLADGHSCTLQVIAWDSSDGFLNQVLITGVLWDPVSFVSDLFGKAAYLTAGAVVTGPPPINTLALSTSSPIALSNPYSGTGALDLSGAGAVAKGMQWQVASAPSGAGETLGFLPTYEERVLQLVAYFLLADSSLVPEIPTDTHSAQGIIRFGGRPDHIDYWVTPGFTVNLWWLI
jgi:hypothetical protein